MAILLGPRGTYKSFVALHWAMSIAIEGSPVVLVSAEGSGLDRRCRAWLCRNAPNVKPANVPVYAIEQRVDFNNEEATAAICADIDRMEAPPVLIVIDTFSKNSGGLDENSNSEVKGFIGRLDVNLKRRYGATVLLCHHTGHQERGRARGASALEADTDAAYVINRSPGATAVTVSRERFKDSSDLAPLAYRAEVIRLGETDDDGKEITSLVMVPVDSSTVATEQRRDQPRGLRQRELLKALRSIQAGSTGTCVWGSTELRRIARDLGMSKQTAQDCGSAVAHFYLTATVGGWRLPLEISRSEGPKRSETGPPADLTPPLGGEGCSDLSSDRVSNRLEIAPVPP